MLLLTTYDHKHLPGPVIVLGYFVIKFKSWDGLKLYL